MAAVSGPATPQRPLPGAYLATPAPGQGQTIFAGNAASLRQNPAPQQTASSGDSSAPQSMTVLERAARHIDETLAGERRFPALEDYIGQGVSGEYDVPRNPAWLPFQKLKMYDLPPRLLEQSSQSGLGMLMGVFTPLHHAWASLDNALYLWDYTTPNPEIIGYEENPHVITSVKLVPPKPGVFVADITALVVVCTTVDMQLLGVGKQTTSTGAETIALYNTRMMIPARGLAVTEIVGSKLGRIFFIGDASDDIYEFQYQQDEGWFRGKCSRVCHTKASYTFVANNLQAVGQYFGPAAQTKKLLQIIIDDSRNLLYTLSSKSEIRIWLIKDRLEQSLGRPLPTLLQSTGHFNSRTELLTGSGVFLCAISVIPAAEAGRLSLVATTNTGCRLYLSVTRGYGQSADAQNSPNSMQILHIRYPPKDPNASQSQPSPGQSSQPSFNSSAGQVDTSSRVLTPTQMAYRYSPGYWFAFQPQKEDSRKDRVFIVAPDTARLKNPQDTAQPGTRFSEYGQWIDLPSNLQQVMPSSASSGATAEPQGFGNELALQFDSTSPEFAIVTSAGIQTIRRRKLVDVFAALMKYGSADDEGIEGDVKRFVARYGRDETAATALAVACGQGLDVTDSRVASVTEPDVLSKARKVFIEHGGKASINDNAVVGTNAATLDNVRPSPRYEGLSLYVSRLVRSIWGASIVKDVAKPGVGVQPDSNIPIAKLQGIQRDLSGLKEFLEHNKSMIEGLTGPQALSRTASRNDELALQGEHRAMSGLVSLVNGIIEGISFVLTLFEERISEILALLSEDNRRRTRELKYQTLFISPAGRDLAKELVKAIVNRNIANGSNVDTVAEALRRKCGSFCSADDVVIFKAQEQLNRASEAGAQTENGRALLNESQRLFQRVASSLSFDYLQGAVHQYAEMEFYAGAIQLCLSVAAEKDKAKRALAWQRDGKPASDPRQQAFETRLSCYKLIFSTIQLLDKSTASQPESIDGRWTVATKRRNEAYDIVNNSDDAVFLTCLYDWYVGDLNQPAHLLDIDNAHVVEYLERHSEDSHLHADLLWRYFVHHHDFLQAASVQLDIARSHFEISLQDRISYLSQARANASTRQTALMDSRQNKQKVLREVSDLLDIASVQDELLQRISGETRIAADVKPRYIAELNNQILSVGDLYNRYADNAGYHDICILLYQVADHRNPADILTSWQQLINQTHQETAAIYGKQLAAWENVGEKIREMGRRLQISPPTFPVNALLPLLEKYRIANANKESIPRTWAVDIFLDLGLPHETLLPVLESVYYSNEAPFTGSKRRGIAGNVVYLLRKWYEASDRSGERVLFGSEENGQLVRECLVGLSRGADALDSRDRREAEELLAVIARALR